MQVKKTVAMVAVAALIASASISSAEVKIVRETPENLIKSTQSGYGSTPESAGSIGSAGSPLGLITIILVGGAALAILLNKGDGAAPLNIAK
jgi:hypothetical protein